jgi:ribosomal protein S18 acetylase RimI-like enzyme
MLALARASPAGHVHVVDLPYRLCSWAFDNPANIGLWEGSDGRLLAWAVLQPPFWTLDYALHPAAPPETFANLLAWAAVAAQQLLDSPYGRPKWFIVVPEGEVERRRALEAAGFILQDEGEDTWSQVTLALEAVSELPPCPVKSGFTLRPLRGEDEAAAYAALHRAVFGSTNMTEGWRREVIRHPAYNPDLDLVIEDEAGELVAFCVAWVALLPPSSVSGRPSVLGQIEPIGVREDGRRHGLAWSILAEAIRRLRAAGAETILVQTDNYRDRAFAFYHAAGFGIIEHLAVYGREAGPEG